VVHLTRLHALTYAELVQIPFVIHMAPFLFYRCVGYNGSLNLSTLALAGHWVRKVAYVDGFSLRNAVYGPGVSLSSSAMSRSYIVISACRHKN
jgi:hypothetical protein